MSSFSISPTVSGNSTWNLGSNGPLDLNTAGTWTIVPSSTFSVDAKIWGAGAGRTFSDGGAGGAAVGRIELVSGTSYQLIVGAGGAGTSSPNRNGSGGGGGTGIQLSSGSVAILVAGGGGGSCSGTGGAGGGTNGEAAQNTEGPGQGGTQSAAGAGGAGGRRTGSSGSGRNGGQGAGSGGASLSGGAGFGNGGAGAFDGGDAGGGGGGGGYFGGGGGGGNSGGGGGGGGSGYTHPSLVINGVLYAGTGTTPGLSADAQRGTAGAAGVTGSVNGGTGKIYMALYTPVDGFIGNPASVTSGATISISFFHASSSSSATPVSYTITGVTSDDIMGASLTGNFTLSGITYSLTIVTRPKLTTTNTLTIAALGFTASVIINPGLAVRYLIVGGGGGGGSDMGGGGGAGGYLAGNNLGLTDPSYTIVVGSGGAGAPAGTVGPRGTNGQNTTAFGFSAIGGGGGASDHDTAAYPAGDGGSGGGGSGGRQSLASYGGLPGVGTSGQGNNGAPSGVTWYPGGGGGSGAAPTQTGSQIAHGGIGTQNNITGTNLYWAAGGGGAGYSTWGGNGGLGGAGGGAPREGAGTTNGTGGGSALNSGSSAEIGALSTQTNKRGGAAGANTGSGGGGGSHFNLTNDGGNGGSGIVVIRYPGGVRASGGTITTVGTDTLHTFTTSGTLALFTGGLSANRTTAFWGDSITFTYGADVANGTTEAYTITGVTSPEISGASLTGNFTFTDGQATLTINLASLSYTNVTTLVLTSGSYTISIPITYVVSVVASGTGMSWGESRTVTVSTRGLNNGSNIAYSMTGATSAQLAGASLTGNLTVTAVSQADTRGQYSVLFNGSTGYLSIPAGTAFSFGTGDFTIECFMRTTNNTLVGAGYSRSIMRIGNFDFYLRIPAYHGGTDGALRVDGLSDGSTVSLKDGLWHHIALVRESNIIRLWIDGVYQTLGSGATYTANHTNSDANIIGGRSNPIDGYFDGHISNVRVVKGAAVYTGTSNITVPLGGLAAITGTSLLACRSSRVIDLSTNNHTITVNGGATVNTFNPVPTTFSNYFDGTGDYITVADNAAFEMPGDFTVEAFFYCQSLPGAGLFANIISKGAAGVFQPYYIFINNSGSLLFYSSSNGSSWNVANGSSFGTVQVGRWHHVAVSRVGANLRLFLDGALITTITNSDALTDNNRAVAIGARSDGTEDKFVGWISNVRIVKGTGVYTAAFTVPTSPLTVIAGTSLLTCQSSRFRDASANNFTITVAGNTAISSFNPVELASYSNFFDGTGDFLSFTNASAMTLGTSDFTVEAWVYPTALPGVSTNWWNVLDVRGSTSAAPWIFGMRMVSSTLRNTFYASGAEYQSTTVVPLNQWTHIAWSRQGTTLRGFVNGVLENTVTGFSTNLTASGTSYIGTLIDGWMATGYISNLRVVADTALYTAAFTPPNTVLTAVAGTRLLTCRSNRLIDLSSNNITLTRNGDARVDALIPDIGFTPATIAPIGSAILSISTNPSEPILNQATLVVTTAGTTRTFTIKTLGPNDFEVFKSGMSSIEYIDTEVSDVHAQGLEALVTTFASLAGILEPAKLVSGMSSIEYIDTEVTDVHNQNLEAKITTIAQLGTNEKPSALKSNITGFVAAPTYAYSSGEDVKVSPPAVQTWYI